MFRSTRRSTTKTTKTAAKTNRNRTVVGASHHMGVLEALEHRWLLSAGFSAGSDNDLAYDAAGNLHLAYYDSSAKNLKYVVQSPNGNWSTPVTVDAGSPDVGQDVSLAVSAGGRAGIAYYDAVNADLKFAINVRGMWRVSVVNSKGVTGQSPSLAFTPGGVPVISYYSASAHELRYATQDKAGNWVLSSITANRASAYSSVAVDPVTGVPTVAYENSKGGVYVLQATASGLTAPVMVANANSTTGEISLGLAATGRPVISYYDSGAGSLKIVAGEKKGRYSITSVAQVPAGQDPHSSLLFNAATGVLQVVYRDAAQQGIFVGSYQSKSGSFKIAMLKSGTDQNTKAASKAGSGSLTYTTFDAGGNMLSVNDTGVTPMPPTNVTTIGVSPSRINITWVDNSTNETGFSVERSTDGVNFSAVGGVGANVRSWASTGLAASTKYYYRVRALGSAGNSGYSNVGSATTQGVSQAGAPAAPTNLTLAKSTSVANAINLSWIDNASNETGYKIERSTDGVHFAALAGGGSNLTFYRNTGLTPGHRYYYRVYAVNAAGNSLYSNVASLLL